MSATCPTTYHYYILEGRYYRGQKYRHHLEFTSQLLQCLILILNYNLKYCTTNRICSYTLTYSLTQTRDIRSIYLQTRGNLSPLLSLTVPSHFLASSLYISFPIYRHGASYSPIHNIRTLRVWYVYVCVLPLRTCPNSWAQSTHTGGLGGAGRGGGTAREGV